MISISHETDYVHIIVTGEFDIKDYKEFEENVLYEFKFHGRTNMIFDLSNMINYTLDVAIEEIKFLRANKRSFGKVAVISTDQMVAWGSWLNAMLSDAEIRTFESVDDAKAWIEGEPEVQLSENI